LPILEVMGGKILYMGPLGAASIVKVLTNLLALGHLLLAGEAFMVGRQAGIDLNALFEGIKASSGNSYTIETEMPLVYNGSYDVGFSMALSCKDLGLTMDLARKHGVPLELGGLIEQIFMRAKNQYGNGANSTQAVKLLEDAMQVYLRAPGYESFGSPGRSFESRPAVTGTHGRPQCPPAISNPAIVSPDIMDAGEPPKSGELSP